MTGSVITVAVEGDTDVPVVRRVLELIGLEMGPVHGLKGKSRLDQQITAYNHAARHARWLVLRDLDQDAPCAPALLRQLLPQPAPSMLLRVAVHASEAWLLADRERISQFLSVAGHHIPAAPENLPNPKQMMVNLARKSRKRAIREDMVPVPGTTARVGPGYTFRIMEFATTLWRPEVAARVSNSLARCISALQRVTTQ